MRYKDILFAAESKFKDEWVLTPVHYEGSTLEPGVREWVHVNVTVLGTEHQCYCGDTDEVHGIYITCYARTKVQAAELADQAGAFIAMKKLGDFRTGYAQPVHQSNSTRDEYFYRFMVYIKT